jgi:transcriptional regulator with XRE-family HTH domain
VWDGCVESKALSRAPETDSFGLKIFTLRSKRGITQAALAHASGISAAYLSSLENERRPPPRDAVTQRLASALELDLNAAAELKAQGRMERGRTRSSLPQLADAPEHIRQYLGEVWELRNALSPAKVQQLRSELRGAAM